MLVKYLITIIAAVGILISAVFSGQSSAQAQATVSNVNVVVEMTIVTPIVRSQDAWTTLQPGQFVRVASIMDVFVWHSQDGKSFLVGWDGINVLGSKNGNNWDVELLGKRIGWDPTQGDLKLSGTFDHLFFPGTDQETIQKFQGDLYLRYTNGVLITTWGFVPVGKP